MKYEIDVSRFNNNYINRLLSRVEEAVENDTYVHPEDVAKATSFYDHQLGIIDRKAERLVNNLKKENAELDKELEAIGVDPSEVEAEAVA
jgi:hypothetical protein